jgi:predicted ArsR family transcriptional regulator
MNPPTNRELDVLRLVRLTLRFKQPMPTIQEFADYVGISREAASIHVNNLIKKGYLARNYNGALIVQKWE